MITNTLRMIGLVMAYAWLMNVSVPVHAQDSVTSYVPADTTVAVLPVVNLSGEKDKKAKARQAEAAFVELHKQFSDRGFRLVDDKAVADAITAAKVDLSDEEQHARQTFLNIGAAVNADLVVFVTIDKVSQKVNQRLFTAAKEGRAKITIWLLDVKQQKPIVSARPQESKSSAGQSVFNPRFQSGSKRILGACSNAVSDALADPLKPYPLAGQKLSRAR